MIEFDNLTYLHGKPQGTGLLKANPEDFVVVEDLGFEPDGEGEHILVRILKNGCNTRFVADALAKFLKIHAREVSFAGQKDKHAVTEQWLCARVPGKEMPDLERLSTGRLPGAGVCAAQAQAAFRGAERKRLYPGSARSEQSR